MDVKQIAELFDAEFGFMLQFFDEVVKKLNLKKDANILDIGTGEGRMAIALALNGYKVLTGEPESDDTEYAKRDWLENAKKVEVDHLITFKYYNAEEMPFEDKIFDAIFIQGALHHIGDKASAFKESYRVMKKDGLLCILEPTPMGIKRIKKRMPNHPDAVDPIKMAKIYPLTVEIFEGTVFNAFIFRNI